MPRCCGLRRYIYPHPAASTGAATLRRMVSHDSPTSPSPDSPEYDPRRRARHLYWQGLRVTRISELLDVKVPTIHSWKRRDKWDESSATDRVEQSIEARLVALVNKPDKDGRDFKEIDLLGRQIERLARVGRYQETHNEADLNPARSNGGKAHRKTQKNEFSPEQEKRLHEAFLDAIFDYQRGWYRAGLVERIRNILKSRQIGATWYFAREALDDAVKTGRNQIFLSASKAQAHVFKSYIQQFGKDAADVELKGDPIILPNDAQLHFLGTNSRTAQSYHGNLYVDEYFWIHKFQELRKVASGMAAHRHWRQTYFSTPSSLLHDAYPFWTGALFNKGRDVASRAEIDISHAALAAGVRGGDGQWRQIVTLDDAMAGGCNLFDREQILREYSPAEFANLFMCEFIDDSASVFPFSVMQRCLVDSWVVWEDFKPFALRPLGNREVWVGYDPSHTGDTAALVVLAPPLVPNGKFRVLFRQQFKGMDFEHQAEAIRKVTQDFNVTYIGVDVTGVGQGVYQLVTKFFPAARAFSYSPAVKMGLVLKAADVISKGRLEYDAGWKEMTASFLAIRKTTTESGRQPTFEAGRSEDTSHADLAWATMHALANEPLEGRTAQGTNIMEIY